MRFPRLSLLLLVAAATLPVGLHAQDVEQLPDSVRNMVLQLRALEDSLQPIEQLALAQNDELLQRSTAIQDDVVDRMIELYPQLADGMERLVALDQQLEQARSQGDLQEVTRLIAHGNALNDSIQAARNEALQDEELAQRLLTFQEDLVAEMIEVNPRAQGIIDRMNALQARIEAADIGTGSGGGGGGG